jgi:hypothetical protein
MANFKKFLNKKFLFVFVFVLILVVGGLFFWWQGREIKGSPEDYVIIETEEGKFVENKKAGLLVKTPEGWEAEKIEFSDGSMGFYAPETEGRWQDEMIKPPLNKGCAIGTAVIYKKMDFDEVKEEIKEIHAGLGILSEELEIITINNRQALKNTFDSKFIGPSIGVYFLNKNKLYSFALYWAIDEKEKCIQEFESFLETISIK